MSKERFCEIEGKRYVVTDEKAVLDIITYGILHYTKRSRGNNYDQSCPCSIGEAYYCNCSSGRNSNITMTAIISPPCSHQLKGGITSANEDDSRAIDLGDKNGIILVRCREIIAYYEEESQKPDHEMARWLVEQLSQDEQEVAAQCSYAYWFLVQNNTSQSPPSTMHITESARYATAIREAIRHRDCADNRKDVLRVFRATIKFHLRNKTTLYRTCMLPQANTFNCDRNILLCKNRRERIDDEMKNYQTNVVRGHDKEDRAIFFAFSRKVSGTADTQDAFVDSITYSIERAIASSEYHSIGRQDQIVCILETKGGSCPPFKTAQAAVGVLQNFYPGRLKTCVILNPPYLVTALYKMLKPFMHPVTAAKFLLMSEKQLNKSIENDDSVISRLVDESQATPALMPGRGKLMSEVDVDYFLYSVPFCRLYDTYDEKPRHTKGYLLQQVQETKEKEPLHRELSLCRTDSLSSDSLSSCDSEKGNLSEKNDVGDMHRMGSGTYATQRKQQSNAPAVVSVRSLAVGQLSVGNEEPTPPLASKFNSRVVALKINPSASTTILDSPHLVG